MNSEEILQLIAQKHIGEVFLPECKVGSAYIGRGHNIRLDAWAMKKSWSHPFSYGYEIKVSRSDFTRDVKWESYLPYCTHFSFVCPAEIVKPGDLPDGIGLLWVVNGKLKSIRHPKYRAVVVPEALYRYVLMWRLGEVESKEARMKRFMQWLAIKAEYRGVGLAVGNALQKRLTHYKDQNAALKKENDIFAKLSKALEKHGLTPDELASHYHAAIARIKEAAASRHTQPPPAATRTPSAPKGHYDWTTGKIS